MMLFEVNDIIFLVKWLNCITSSFNILNYVSFCEHGTRSSTHHTLKQSVLCTITKPNTFTSTDFHAHLWNSLPTIDLNQPLPTIISELKQFFWNHFTANYDPLIYMYAPLPVPLLQMFCITLDQLLSTQYIHLMFAYIYRFLAVSFKSNGPSVHSLHFQLNCNPFHCKVIIIIIIIIVIIVTAQVN